MCPEAGKDSKYFLGGVLRPGSADRSKGNPLKINMENPHEPLFKYGRVRRALVWIDFTEKNPPNSLGPCLESNSKLGEADRQRFGVRKVKKQDVRALALRVQ